MVVVCSSKRGAGAGAGKSGNARSVYYDFKQVRKNFNVDKKSEVTRHRRPESYQDVVKTHHVYHVQPIILRQRVHTTVRHIIQPVLESEDVQENHQPTVQEYRPVQYNEYLHDISDEHKQKIADNRLRVAETGGRIEMPDTYEKVFKDPQIHENVIERVREEIQPVLKRNINRTKVVEEVVPTVEVHERVMAVDDVIENEPINFDEYLKWCD